jgi:hypothetical protein
VSIVNQLQVPVEDEIEDKYDMLPNSASPRDVSYSVSGGQVAPSQQSETENTNIEANGGDYDDPYRTRGMSQFAPTSQKVPSFIPSTSFTPSKVAVTPTETVSYTEPPVPSTQQSEVPMENKYTEQREDDDDPYRTRGMSEYGQTMSQKFNTLAFTPSNSNPQTNMLSSYENKVNTEEEYIHISQPIEEQYIENDMQNSEYELQQDTVYEAPQVQFQDINMGLDTTNYEMDPYGDPYDTFAAPSYPISPKVNTFFQPSVQPSVQPSIQHSFQPSVQASFQPSVLTSFQPSVQPSFQPSARSTKSDASSFQPSEKSSTNEVMSIARGLSTLRSIM